MRPTNPAAQNYSEVVELLRARGDDYADDILIVAAFAIERMAQERDEALKERTVAQFQRNALVELSGQKGNAAFGALFVRMADALYDKRQVEAERDRLARENERLRAALETVEWIMTVEDQLAGECPWCGCAMKDGHASDCLRQLALGLRKVATA